MVVDSDVMVPPCAIFNSRIWPAELRMIEEVERFRAEL
jgi:hypothetical protein